MRERGKAQNTQETVLINGSAFFLSKLFISMLTGLNLLVQLMSCDRVKR